MDIDRLRVQTMTITFQMDQYPHPGDLDTIESMFTFPNLRVTDVQVVPERLEVTSFGDRNPTHITTSCALEVTWESRR